MKNQCLSISVILILIIFCFSGCFGDNKSSGITTDSSKFIGSWYGWSHYPNFYEIWTFYENMSLKIDDRFDIEWGTFSINGNELVINTPLTGFENEYMKTRYTFSFSENDLRLTLTNSNWEEDTAEFFKDGYRGELYQKIRNFIGKWSNQTTYDNYGDCGEWTSYDNYTFYPNFTVKGEYNWCTSGSNIWHTFLYDYKLDEQDWICIGTGCSEYNFLEDNTVFNYQGKKYHKVE
jgi:hypothetical protein